MNTVLLVDDDNSLRGVISFALQAEGYKVLEATNGEEALEVIRGSRVNLVITDLKMPRMDGISLLRAIREEGIDIPIIVLTAFGTIERAVEAMKLGAFNYLTKPYNRDELRIVVHNALEQEKIREENRCLKQRLHDWEGKIPLVYASKPMEELVDTIRQIGPTDATVLITGESGTGKELVARGLHEMSRRREKRLVVVNCGAIPRDLIESELFGFAKGAFTGAIRDKRGRFISASGGTLFLDEIGELPPDLQTKLLRVLETGEVDVLGTERPVNVDIRFVAATNANLQEAIQEGRFREDLYYRLKVIPIHIPPLRSRRDDIPALWEHFVKVYGDGEKIRTELPLIKKLMSLPWRGNVRELANLCHRMILLRHGNALTLKDAPPEIQSAPLQAEDVYLAKIVRELPEHSLPLWELECEIIKKALAMFDGNKSKTAQYLSIPRHVLIYRIQKYSLDMEDSRTD